MSDDYETSFQNFMMTGAAPSTPISAKTTTTTPSTPEIAPVTKSPYMRTAIKQCSTIVKAFQGTLQRDWLEVDDNLAAVVRSISNLRDRIYWSSQQLAVPYNTSGNDWKTPRGARVHLEHQDIELALKHELQQHEQMMAGARSLLNSLNQAQEALGRRLAEGMQLCLEIRANPHSMDDKTLSSLSSVDALEDVYHILADELYIKQVMVQEMLNCTNDYLFASDDDVVTADENPRRIAHRCSTKWTLMSQQADIKELMQL